MHSTGNDLADAVANGVARGQVQADVCIVYEDGLHAPVGARPLRVAIPYPSQLPPTAQSDTSIPFTNLKKDAIKTHAAYSSRLRSTRRTIDQT